MVSPSKLKSLVDAQSASPDIAPLMGTRASAPEDDYDDDGDEEEDEAPADPLTRGNELISSWGEQGEALKESAGEIIDGAHEVGGNLLLATVPEEAQEEAEDSFDDMPEEIQIVFAQHVAPLADADLTALATALIDGNDGDTETPDVKLVTAYLKCVAAYAKTEVDPDDFVQDEEDEEDEDDEEDEEDEDDEDDAEKPAAAAAPAADGGVSAAPVGSPTGPLA